MDFILNFCDNIFVFWRLHDPPSTNNIVDVVDFLIFVLFKWPSGAALIVYNMFLKFDFIGSINLAPIKPNLLRGGF